MSTMIIDSDDYNDDDDDDDIVKMSNLVQRLILRFKLLI